MAVFNWHAKALRRKETANTSPFKSDSYALFVRKCVDKLSQLSIKPVGRLYFFAP
jgi:hypothetical protein